MRSGINKEWSEIQKAIYIYDQLKRKVIYTLGGEEKYTNEDSRTLRGLISGENVCAGYAVIYKEMMDRQNIECDCVSGVAIDSKTQEIEAGHAWNILKINGVNIPVDLTWDSCMYRYAASAEVYFGNVDKFNEAHVPRDKERIQDYAKDLVGFDPEFVKITQRSVRRVQEYDNRCSRATRADGSKFIISLLRQNNKNGLNEYLYADIDENGYPKNPTTLFSKSNIASLIEQYKRCDREKEAKHFESLRKSSRFVINELLSKENIENARKNNGYIGEYKKENGKCEIVQSLSENEIKHLPRMITTIKRNNGTMAVLSRHSISHIGSTKLYGYALYDIDSHIYRSSTQKDYYVVNSNRLYSESNFEKIIANGISENRMTVWFSPERVQKMQQEHGGYIGCMDPNTGVSTRDEKIDRILKSNTIDFTQNDVVKAGPINYDRKRIQNKLKRPNELGLSNPQDVSEALKLIASKVSWSEVMRAKEIIDNSINKTEEKNKVER